MKVNQSPSVKPRKFLWFLVCLAILAVGYGSLVVLKGLKEKPKQKQPMVLVPAVEVRSLEYRDSALLIEGYGKVSPRAEISLSPQITGRVIHTHPNLITGGSFEKGDIIVQIDPRSFKAKLAEAQADKTSSISDLKYINKRIKRLNSLKSGGYAAEEGIDDALRNRDQAIAAIARHNAVIEIRQLDLERTSIKAPFTGKILAKSVAIGDIVSPGDELARFYASDEVEIVVSLNATDASFISGLWELEHHLKENKVQQHFAGITVNHGGQLYQWDGYLDRVEADIDGDTRTVDVVVRVPEPFRPGNLIKKKHSILIGAPPLLIGMYATVMIEGMELANHFVLPISALRNDSTIWVVGPEGRLSIEPVELVKQEDNLAVLLAPQLTVGTQIITSNIALVSDGMKVRIKQASQKAKETQEQA